MPASADAEQQQASDPGPLNVLFLCTANSARSILAEAILRHLGGDRFNAYSAGSHPAGRPNPLAIELLEAKSIPTATLRSKGWDEFAAAAAPPLDIVITVCNNAAGEVCPMWPGRPVTAHWGIPDPAIVAGSDETRRAAFEDAYQLLAARVRLLLSLPASKLDRLSLRQSLDEIGHPL